MNFSISSFKTLIQNDPDSKSQEKVLERINTRRSELGLNPKSPTSTSSIQNSNSVEELENLSGAIGRSCQNPKTMDVVTSGSGGVPKIIPLTTEFIRSNHFKVVKQCLFNVWKNFDAGISIAPKFLIISGYAHKSEDSDLVDISYALASEIPVQFRTLSVLNGQFDSWQSRIDFLSSNATQLREVSVLVGMPTWLVQLVKDLEERGHRIMEIFPNLKLILHSGVSILPYKDFLKQKFGKGVSYCDAYNASEGFFGFQAKQDLGDFQLSLNSDIYFEFVGVESGDVYNVSSVKPDEHYEMIISTWDGLMNYSTGDRVIITGKNPLKIKLLGRMQEHINVFGEHINANQLITVMLLASNKGLIDYHDYFMIPCLATENELTKHQLYVELSDESCNLEAAAVFIDGSLAQLNPHFKKKRDNGVIGHVELVQLQNGAFAAYYESKKKIGSQIKLNKLFNDREVLTLFGSKHE